VRALTAGLAFLLVLVFLGLAPASFDIWLVMLAWAAFLAGAIVIAAKSIRDGQAVIGQLGALPRSWQRWILDEPDRRDS
jgi:hypothetical protein